MPTIDLRDQSRGLQPLAPFKVLAVMCHPSDRTMRQRMLALLHRETGVGTPRRAGLSNEEFYKEVETRKNRGILAGALLLNPSAIAGKRHSSEPQPSHGAYPTPP